MRSNVQHIRVTTPIITSLTFIFWIFQVHTLSTLSSPSPKYKVQRLNTKDLGWHLRVEHKLLVSRRSDCDLLLMFTRCDCVASGTVMTCSDPCLSRVSPPTWSELTGSRVTYGQILTLANNFDSSWSTDANIRDDAILWAVSALHQSGPVSRDSGSGPTPFHISLVTSNILSELAGV